MTNAEKPELIFGQLMKRLMKLRLGEMPKLDYDLSLHQMGLIMFIWESKNCRIQDIATGLGITPPSASVAISRLEKQGWITREPDPLDRRASRISLSQKSTKLAQHVHKAQRKGVIDFFSGLDPDEQSQFIKLLRKGIISVEEKNN